MGAQAFDLADRLQTPVFVMLELDTGMQDWLTAPFRWDDSRALDRGKVMSAEELEAGRDFGLAPVVAVESARRPDERSSVA